MFLQVITGTADGRPDGQLRIKALDDGEGREHALVATDDPDVWRAPDATPGPYRVYTDTGWGMLWAGTKGSAAPRLRGHDYPPALVRMGKPRTLYVAIADPSLPSAPVSTTWAADTRALDAVNSDTSLPSPGRFTRKFSVDLAPQSRPQDRAAVDLDQ